MFADIVDTFVEQETHRIMESVQETVILLCYVGLVVWVLSYLYFTILAFASERIARKTRVAYFESLINQEAKWYETDKTP
jgi:ABC-type multidrug transport system fused ATPase/permease subunit